MKGQVLRLCYCASNVCVPFNKYKFHQKLYARLDQAKTNKLHRALLFQWSAKDEIT